MKKGVIKFYAIKLLLIFLVSVCAAVTAYLAGNVASETDGILRTLIASGVPFIFFMYFMYTVEARIKLPEGCTMSFEYLLKFALSETSVYAIFLLPITVICLVNPDFFASSGLLRYFYIPHSLLTLLTGSSLINWLAMSVFFGVVAALAHYIKSTRPVPLTEPIQSDALRSDESVDEETDEKLDIDESVSPDGDDINDAE